MIDKQHDVRDLKFQEKAITFYFENLIDQAIEYKDKVQSFIL